MVYEGLGAGGEQDAANNIGPEAAAAALLQAAKKSASTAAAGGGGGGGGGGILQPESEGGSSAAREAPPAEVVEKADVGAVEPLPALRHVHFATLPGMWDRTITISSAGKTFSVTGWQVQQGIERGKSYRLFSRRALRFGGCPRELFRWGLSGSFLTPFVLMLPRVASIRLLHLVARSTKVGRLHVLLR